MYRRRDTTALVSYIWLDSRKKKSFEQDLARLQDSGAIYRTTLPDDYGEERTLILSNQLQTPASDANTKC